MRRQLHQSSYLLLPFAWILQLDSAHTALAFPSTPTEEDSVLMTRFSRIHKVNADISSRQIQIYGDNNIEENRNDYNTGEEIKYEQPNELKLLQRRHNRLLRLGSQSTPSHVPTSYPSFAPSQEPTESPWPTQIQYVDASPTPDPVSSGDLQRFVPTSSSPTQTPTATPTYLSFLPPPSRAPTAQPTSLSSLTSWTPTKPSLESTSVPSRGQAGEAPMDVYDESTVSGGYVHTCTSIIPHDARKDLIQEFFANIAYTYHLIIRTDTDISAAVLEGERQIGEGVAEIMCRRRFNYFRGINGSGNDNPQRRMSSSSSPAPPFLLHQLNSLSRDKYDGGGSCASTLEGTECHIVYGQFAAAMWVNPNTENSTENIKETFQQVLNQVLPNVMGSLVVFHDDNDIEGQEKNDTTIAEVTPNTEDQNNYDDSSSSSSMDFSMALTSALMGVVAVLLIVAVALFVLGIQKRKQQRRSDPNNGESSSVGKTTKPLDSSKSRSYDEESTPAKDLDIGETDDDAEHVIVFDSMGNQIGTAQGSKHPSNIVSARHDGVSHHTAITMDRDTGCNTIAQNTDFDQMSELSGDTLSWLGVDVLGKSIRGEGSQRSLSLCGQEYQLSEHEGSLQE